MKFLLSLLSTYILCSSLNVHAQPKLPPLTDSIDSKILGETRGIQVIMPDGYKPGSDDKFEIVYVLDGEWYYELVPNTFKFAQSAEYTPKQIFVFIRNQYTNGENMRSRDFSPRPFQGDTISFGGSDRFYEFLIKEVVPYIEKKYPSNGQRTLVGSSFSGLFTLFAFSKDPAFFNSFVASDPNMSWDEEYVTKQVANRLKNMPPDPGTLYVGALTSSFREMGNASLDSVLKNFAPKNLKWKCVAYENESHYSVQLKAFYDGARFSHLGYSTRPPEFHPMKGTFKSEKGFPIFFLNLSPLVRYTIDGTEPGDSSPAMVRMQTVNLRPPVTLRVQSYGNRRTYTQNWTAEFKEGIIKPKQRNTGKDKLEYAIYQTGSTKPVKSGTADSTFKFSNIDVPNATMVLQGSLYIPEDGTYVLYVDGYNKMRFDFEGATILQLDTADLYPSQSYLASLVKGNYSLKLEMSRHAERQPNFRIFKSAPPHEQWWMWQWKHF